MKIMENKFFKPTEIHLKLSSDNTSKTVNTDKPESNSELNTESKENLKLGFYEEKPDTKAKNNGQ